jgi:hypothetical protein
MCQDSHQAILPFATSLVGPPDSMTLMQLGCGLFDQQMWCWGRDIHHPAGNALCRYGFVPLRPPLSDHGSSAYIFSQGPELSIVLWGFGLFCGSSAAEPTGLFLKRYEFTPRLTPTADPPRAVWAPEQLPSLRDPQAPDEWSRLQSLFTAALHWIASYEQWVTQTLGREYRRRCVAGWSRAVVASEAMAATWRQLAASRKAVSETPGSQAENDHAA